MLNIDKILDRVRDFPTLPTMFVKLLDMIANPNTNIQDLAVLISKDVAIASKVLQVVNSPLYGLLNRVDTISQAIFYIGFNEIRNICLAVSVIEVFKSVSAGSKFNIVELWKHSIAVGTITRLVGLSAKVGNLDNYFVAGIMHDIGKLFFIKFFSNKYLELIEEAYEESLPLETLEKKYFGINHLILGELIAKKWNLPTSLSNTIRYHGVGLTDAFDTIVACVHVANIVANTLELGHSGNHMIPRPNREIWSKLNLPEGFFAETRDIFVANYSQSILGLQLDG